MELSSVWPVDLGYMQWEDKTLQSLFAKVDEESRQGRKERFLIVIIGDGWKVPLRILYY